MFQSVRSRWPLVLVAGLLLTHCADLLTFPVEQESSTLVEGAGILGDLFEALDLVGLDGFELEIEQAMEDQGVEQGDLESVLVTSLALEASPDLSFMESLEVYVQAQGIDEQLLASADEFPDGQERVELTLEDLDLKDLVIAGGMSFRAKVTGRLPSDDTEITVSMSAEVQATVAGACNAASK